MVPSISSTIALLIVALLVELACYPHNTIGDSSDDIDDNALHIIHIKVIQPATDKLIGEGKAAQHEHNTEELIDGITSEVHYISYLLDACLQGKYNTTTALLSSTKIKKFLPISACTMP